MGELPSDVSIFDRILHPIPVSDLKKLSIVNTPDCHTPPLPTEIGPGVMDAPALQNLILSAFFPNSMISVSIWPRLTDAIEVGRPENENGTRIPVDRHRQRPEAMQCNAAVLMLELLISIDHQELELFRSLSLCPCPSPCVPGRHPSIAFYEIFRLPSIRNVEFLVDNRYHFHALHIFVGALQAHVQCLTTYDLCTVLKPRE
ncbi:hypothetical protein BDZ97DRAFT_976493 [Flammula alnicola]|nr:hypothetical protein BDZ97DRAFT_976493 [Flammula alnicola]